MGKKNTPWQPANLTKYMPGEVFRYDGSSFEKEYFMPNITPFAESRALPLFIIELLKEKHRVVIEIENDPVGDYVTFRTREYPHRQFRLSNIQIARGADLSILINMIENGLGLSDSTVKTEKEKNKPRTPADEWADKWAKENELEDI